MQEPWVSDRDWELELEAFEILFPELRCPFCPRAV